MRVYYRGPDALVTSDHLVWYTTPPQTFAVRRLGDVGIVRTGRTGGGATRLGGAPLAVAAAAPGRPLLLAVGALAMAAPVVVAAVQRRRSRGWQLRATYGGRRVVVYASTDTRVFNQVARALWRAIEDIGPVTPRDLAVA